MTGQERGIDPVVTGAQQTDDGTAPDAVFDIEATAGNGDVDVRMLIKLASVGVQVAENTDFNAQLTRVPEHGAGSAAKQRVEQRQVVIEERPQ